MKILLGILACVMLAAPAAAQTQISILDALPPYLLSARLLNNGHFSITTRYTGEPKTLIYQEDGSGGPINYTSHVHFKVDDVIFQLPFELNPVTRDVPPEHPLTITQLYRDTVGGIGRINARMFGVMPDGDTMRFVFTMHPVLRPSGGFIRMQAEVENSSSRPRSVGVLMLVDTKIGDNDRAPIISSFGYSARETEYERAVAPGMPDFWLALEGTPTSPGLAARGNLRASGLIEPDYVLVGNWKDNAAVPGATGLASAQWKERSAFDVGYTDSAVLLLWEEQTMARGERRLRAATEIGIVDSLDVSSSIPAGFWLSGSGLANSCLGFDVVRERPCGTPGYAPYTPDSLQMLYLVTNRSGGDVDGVRLVVPSVPVGLNVDVVANPVLPSTLRVDSTGVSTIAVRPQPRLFTKTFSLPLAVVDGANTTLHRDTICIVVPGLLGKLEVEPLEFLPLCPGQSDTLSVRVHLDGPRCLPLTPQMKLVGAAPDINQFEILTPLPATIPADGFVDVRVRYTAGNVGVRSRVGLAAYASDSGLNADDRDTTIVIGDTGNVEGTSRDAEFFMARPIDTLDFGAVCVGDSSLRDWTLSNVGGCALSIERDYTFENDARGQYSVANDASFPMTIGRGVDTLVDIRFAPTVAGPAIARFIVHSSARPFSDTLIVRGVGDVPRLAIGQRTLPVDTVCPGERFESAINLINPSACDVTVTSVALSDNRFTVSASTPITLNPNSQRQMFVTSSITTPGRHSTQVTIASSDGSTQTVDVEYVVADRAIAHDPSIAFGDVRMGSAPVTRRLTISSTGTAEALVNGLRIVGANAAEFTWTLPNGETLPLRMAPGSQLAVDVRFAPGDIEARSARLVVETGSAGVCQPDAPIELDGRGVMPLLDVPKRRLTLGRRCAGERIDTTIELRNVGNAALTVSGIAQIEPDVRATIEPAGLPLVIAPNESRTLRVTIQPDRLGDFEIALRLDNDGAWFTAPDTVVQFVGTSTLCATVWADTVRGMVGQVVDVPIRIDAKDLSDDDVARLLNDIDAPGLEMTLSHDGRVARFVDVAPLDGMVATAAPQVATTGSTIALTTRDDAGTYAASGIIGTLRAEILLGTSDRTVLDLDVTDFAGGYANLDVRNGMILSEYCALDRRFVSVTGPLVAASSTPLPVDGVVVVHVPVAQATRVALYDAAGAHVALLHEGTLGGTVAIPIGDVDAGIYTVVVTTPGAVASARIVVVR